MAIGVYAGLRVAEICHLDITDVDLEERVIRVREGKGGKDREVALHRAAVAAIAQYLARRDDDEDAMFLSRRGTRISVRAVQRMVKQLAGDAELAKKVTPHRLRHTMATLLLEATGDLRLVQEALGHESISTTQIYTFVALERQRRGIDLMP